MEKFFKELDCITNTEYSEDKKCCDNVKNHLVYNCITTCSQCSNTITNIIIEPEWRFYGSQDTKTCDPTRCGMPVNSLLPESSVGTSISFRGNRNHSMNKLRKFQQWNGVPYKERSLLKVFQEIERVCKCNGLAKIIVNEANSLYKIVSTTKISRGSNRKGIIASCVYFSCKINKFPRSTNEVAYMFNISVPIMTKGCKKFQEIMQINKLDINRIHLTKTINIDDFIDRFCNKLELSTEDLNQIKEISKLSKLYNLISDNTPPSMAAGCIYLYIKEYDLDISRAKIAEVSKISEVTVNKCYKKLEKHKEKILI